jgi:NADH-ubiquinone oxidoreductase chain 1
MTSLSSTLISLIEVVLVLVPALLSVAYVTVAERKTMASMQRRLGPNAVGQNILLKKQTRFYHTTSYPLV